MSTFATKERTGVRSGQVHTWTVSNGGIRSLNIYNFNFRILSILVRISYLIILSQSLYGHRLSLKMEVCGYASIPIECYPFLIKTQG